MHGRYDVRDAHGGNELVRRRPLAESRREDGEGSVSSAMAVQRMRRVTSCSRPIRNYNETRTVSIDGYFTTAWPRTECTRMAQACASTTIEAGETVLVDPQY